MSSPRQDMRNAAAFLGSTAVCLGAMGAHALNKQLTARGMLQNWHTAVLYQLFSATAILGIHTNEEKYVKQAGQLMAVGSTLFSGSIYLLCLQIGPKKILGPTTPIGGLFMIAGWAWLGLGPYF